MGLLTADPLMGKTVFFAKLAWQQDGRRVIEYLHRHEEVKIVNVFLCFLTCLHVLPKHVGHCHCFFMRAHPLPAALFQCPRSRAAALGPVGTKTAGSLPLRRPDCTLSRLHTSKECDRPVTQSIATREPHFVASTRDAARARWGLGCVTTPGSQRSCPGWAYRRLSWILTVFTRLACFHGAFRDRWGLSSPYQVVTTARSSLFVSHWDGTTAGRSFAPLSLLVPLTHQVPAHTQVRDPRGPAAACWWPALRTPSSRPSPLWSSWTFEAVPVRLSFNPFYSTCALVLRCQSRVLALLAFRRGCQHFPRFGRKVERRLVSCFELKDIFRHFPGYSAGASFLVQGFVLCPLLKLFGARMAFVRFTLSNNASWWTLFSPNFSVVPRALGKSDGVIWSQFSVFPQNRFPRMRILRHTTQL